MLMVTDVECMEGSVSFSGCRMPFSVSIIGLDIDELHNPSLMSLHAMNQTFRNWLQLALRHSLSCGTSGFRWRRAM